MSSRTSTHVESHEDILWRIVEPYPHNFRHQNHIQVLSSHSDSYSPDTKREMFQMGQPITLVPSNSGIDNERNYLS